jgi:hypothetical protein
MNTFLSLGRLYLVEVHVFFSIAFGALYEVGAGEESRLSGWNLGKLVLGILVYKVLSK